MTISRLIQKTMQPFLVLGLLVACVAAAAVGGFQLRVEVPTDGSDAVLLVRTYRCHQPEKAKVSARAEGLVEGRRVSIPIRLKAVARGVYAVAQQWPDEGTWVLTFSGSYQRQHASTLVALDGSRTVAVRQTDKGEQLDVRFLHRKLAAADADKALQRIAATGTKTARAGGF